MGQVEKKLYATDETFREVADLLYGDGAEDLIRKFAKTSKPPKTPAQKDQQKRKLTAGLSAVGAGAGALGLAVGAKAIKQDGWKGTPRLTRALIPAEIAGLGGELLATKILHGDAKKGHVTKMDPSASDLNVKSALKRGALKKLAESPQLNQVKVESNKKLKNTFGKSNEIDVLWEGEFSKVDSDKRQVFGWASIVEKDGQPVYDLQGDYIDTDEIEKSAYDYVIKSRKGGDMHRRNADDTPVHSSDMIESFMVTPEKIAKMGLPEGSLPTGWWVGFKVNDDDAWNLVKSGKRTAFSIHGRGQRTPVED